MRAGWGRDGGGDRGLWGMGARKGVEGHAAWGCERHVYNSHGSGISGVQKRARSTPHATCRCVRVCLELPSPVRYARPAALELATDALDAGGF